jgi:hypothetical protein
MITILYFDEKYFRWAPLLIESFRIHEPEGKFALNTFNLPDQQLDELKSFESIVFVKNEEVFFDPLKATSRLYQLVCRKGGFILETMDRYDDELFISMDTDMLLIRELDELKTEMKNSDIGFVHVHSRKVLSGFIAISRTKAARDYIEEYHKRATKGKLCHENDQPILAQIHEKYKNKMKFLHLSRRYLDHLSHDNAFIWSAHKSNFGSKDERYKTYFDKLREMKC